MAPSGGIYSRARQSELTILKIANTIILKDNFYKSFILNIFLKENLMFKLIIIFATLLLLLTACEQQKQASAEVGAVPKQILDKATNEINAVQALAAEKQIAIESVDAPADNGK